MGLGQLTLMMQMRKMSLPLNLHLHSHKVEYAVAYRIKYMFSHAAVKLHTPADTYFVAVDPSICGITKSMNKQSKGVPSTTDFW